MDKMFLILTMMYLIRMFGKRKLLPQLAEIVIRLDPGRIRAYNARKPGQKLPKKWRIYEEFREMVIHKWEKGTLKSAWEFVVFSFDLLDSFTRIFTRIRAVLELIF